ncbi:MAG: RNA methyltransferase, partial [Desulfobacterales bacterium]|nr:RNA methyltransferase [Desulfobacterales bacterium]
MTQRANLDNIAVVLQGPRFPENIGAAARAMRNMGMKRLIVVNPRDCDLTRVLRLATHEAFDVVEEMRMYDTLKEALSTFNYVVGTTARLGGERKVVHSPSNAARKVIPMSAENDVALLFGPEDKGLSNLDIRMCHILVNIPTADFSSLNLAQAVMVMCYEIQVASREKPRPFTPRLASRHELDGMYEQLKDILVR